MIRGVEMIKIYDGKKEYKVQTYSTIEEAGEEFVKLSNGEYIAVGNKEHANATPAYIRKNESSEKRYILSTSDTSKDVITFYNAGLFNIYIVDSTGQQHTVKPWSLLKTTSKSMVMTPQMYGDKTFFVNGKAYKLGGTTNTFDFDGWPGGPFYEVGIWNNEADYKPNQVGAYLYDKYLLAPIIVWGEKGTTINVSVMLSSEVANENNILLYWSSQSGGKGEILFRSPVYNEYPYQDRVDISVCLKDYENPHYSFYEKRNSRSITVVIDGNGGEIDEGITEKWETMKEYTFKNGEYLGLEVLRTKHSEKIFDSWNTLKDVTGQKILTGGVFYDDVSLYTIWKDAAPTLTKIIIEGSSGNALQVKPGGLVRVGTIDANGIASIHELEVRMNPDETKAETYKKEVNLFAPAGITSLDQYIMGYQIEDKKGNRSEIYTVGMKDIITKDTAKLILILK